MLLFPVAILLAPRSSWAWLPLRPPNGGRQVIQSRPASSRTLLQLQTNEPAEKHDIELMRQEAKARLAALEHQLEELKEFEEHRVQDVQLQHHHMAASMDSMEGCASPFFETPEEQHTASHAAQKAKSSTHQQTSEKAVKVEVLADDETILHAPLHLLENTRWKAAFNVGREPGTWMPADWGASGERLRFQVILDFTDISSSSQDEFFMGGATKVCNIVEGFSFPVGVGTSSVGRRPLPLQPTGAYHVARGQGPAGTDLLRFYIEFDHDCYHNDNSDVYVPAGRVYGTCGYFAVTPHSHAHRERLTAEHVALTRRYEEIQREMDMETRVFSMDQVRRMKEQWTIRRKLQELVKKLQRARQQDPERAQLRLSRHGDVGLTKDGGVCCKVHKGVAYEYRILGKMEMGSIDKHDDSDHDHDETTTTSHLHP